MSFSKKMNEGMNYYLRWQLKKLAIVLFAGAIFFIIFGVLAFFDNHEISSKGNYYDAEVQSRYTMSELVGGEIVEAHMFKCFVSRGDFIDYYEVQVDSYETLISLDDVVKIIVHESEAHLASQVKRAKWGNFFGFCGFGFLFIIVGMVTYAFGNGRSLRSLWKI